MNNPLSKILYLGLMVATMVSVCQAITIEGHCYLENRTDHSGIQVLFAECLFGHILDSTYTDTSGYYRSSDLPRNIYTVHYTHEGFIPDQTEPINGFSSVTVTDITLLELIGMPISGSLSGTLWAGTYIVEDDIYVEAGDSLNIEPGTVLYFMGDESVFFDFTIYGVIKIVGTQSDTIKFMSGMEAWGGIKLHGAYASGELAYCLITESNSSGLHISDCSPTISNCLITGNEATNDHQDGGGILCENNASPTISYCTISENYAEGDGDGVYCSYSNPLIEYCHINANSSDGIHLEASEGIINHCSFASNGGKGVYVEASNTEIRNCTIAGSNNGIRSYNSDTVIDSCSISLCNTGISASGNWWDTIIRYCSIYDNYDTGISTGSNTTIQSSTLYGNSANGIAVYYHFTMINSIVAVAGELETSMYFSSSSSYNCDITYCNLDSLVGNIPENLGVITTTNANGDSCDVFNNICADPMFTNPTQNILDLQWGSPCIDAGDPDLLYNDPDGTTADIGAYYYDQSNPFFTVTLTCLSGSPVPAEGGNLFIDAYVFNASGQPQDFDAWLECSYENSTPVTLTLRSFTNFQPGYTINRPEMYYPIPGSWPGGHYTFACKVGENPDVAWAEDSFYFEKMGMADGNTFTPTSVLGAPDPFDQIDEKRIVDLFSEMELHDVFPNPFNPVTTISFSLPHKSYITLSVYDLAGRKVVDLADGWRDAGVHKVSFDASNQASGMYFYRLKTGAGVYVGKMLLIK